MSRATYTPANPVQLPSDIHSQLCLGRIANVEKDGSVSVDVGDGNDPVPARSIVCIDRATAVGLCVLLGYPANSSTGPIIMGVVNDTACSAANAVSETRVELELPDGEDRAIEVDKNRKVLVAKHELKLVCGKSSITLRKNGQVVIRGVEVISRAQRVNKIRGGAVRIN